MTIQQHFDTGDHTAVCGLAGALIITTSRPAVTCDQCKWIMGGLDEAQAMAESEHRFEGGQLCAIVENGLVHTWITRADGEEPVVARLDPAQAIQWANMLIDLAARANPREAAQAMIEDMNRKLQGGQ